MDTYGLIPVSCQPVLANASGADAKLPELQIATISSWSNNIAQCDLLPYVAMYCEPGRLADYVKKEEPRKNQRKNHG